MDAPKQKNSFCFRIKSLEKLPKKKTASEYTWGFRYVKPHVLNITDDSEYLAFLIVKLNFFISLLILPHIKCSKKTKSNRFNVSSINGVKKLWK